MSCGPALLHSGPRAPSVGCLAPEDSVAALSSSGGGLGTLSQYVQKVINGIEIPVSFLHERICHQHVVMVTLIFGNRQTNICIEFKELQGGVRATSILCLLGIGLGVGSVLLYKLCTKILSPALAAAIRGTNTNNNKTDKQLNGTDQQQDRRTGQDATDGSLAPETPDSGISTATTLTHPVSSSVISPDSPCSEDLTFSQPGLRHRSTNYGSPLQQISPPRRPHQFGSQTSSTENGNYDSLYSTKDGPVTGVSDECLYRRGNQSGNHVLYSSVNSDQGFVSGHLYGKEAVWQGSCDQDSLGVRSLPADDHRSHFHPSDVDPHQSSGHLRDTPHRLVSDQSFSPVVAHHHHDDGRSFCTSCCERSSLCDPELSAHYTNYSRTGTYHSTPHTDPECSGLVGRSQASYMQGSLRRNTHSLGSELSHYSDLSLRDSLMGKGYSVGGGENLSGLGTPLSEMFEDESVVPSSTSNMEQIQQEIRMIREEISDMNDKVHVLSSREDLKDIFMLTPDPMKDLEFNQSLRVSRRRRPPIARERSHSESRSCSVSVDGDIEDSLNNSRRSYHHTGEFIWDYQSDLAFEDASNFITNRPVIGDANSLNYGNIDYDSPTFDHVRKYIESCCDVQYDSTNTPSPSLARKRKSTPKQSRTFNSITDMYIEDNFSEFGDSAEFGERNQPEGCHVEERTDANLSENGNYQTTVHKDNELTGRQFSFNAAVDCDNNGNPDDCVTAFATTTEVSPEGVMQRSMCKECGSPSHRHKRNDSPMATEDSASDSVFRSGNSSKSSFNNNNNTAARHCSSSGTSPMHDLAKPNKRLRWEVKNVQPKVNLFEYVEREVKGDSPKVRTIKKGFHQVRSLLGMSHIRPVRGDNYCALRATLYQICVNNYPVLKHLGPLDNILRRLTLFQDPQYSFLHNWNFANRLPYTKESVLERIQECVVCFYKKIEEISRIPRTSEREATFLEMVNFDPEIDLQLLEAIKVFMMLEAAEVYDSYCGLGSKKAPVFAWLMYSRESSENPEALFKNHINCLGDVASAHQNTSHSCSENKDKVELYLLGHTLGVKIEVVRPACYGQENFISHYPDDGADGFPKVYLVAEDNRLYHAVMQ